MVKFYLLLMLHQSVALQIHITGKSLSEALILDLINPKYNDRLFAELRVQYKKTTSSAHVVVHVKETKKNTI
jgi:hypothetical protein